ncbi:MAG: PTS sugar transporter subunit IIB [Ignisphaera sp.]
MKKLKVYALCTFGMGTVFILKMSVEQALKELGIDAEVHATNLTAIKGIVASGGADLLVAQADLESHLKDLCVPTVYVKNFVDREGIKNGIKKVLGIP